MEKQPLLQLAVGCMAVAFLFHLIGLSTSSWTIAQKENSQTIRMGLWTECVESKGVTVCTSYASDPVYIGAVKFFAIVALLAMTGAGGVGVVVIFQEQWEQVIMVAPGLAVGGAISSTIGLLIWSTAVADVGIVYGYSYNLCAFAVGLSLVSAGCFEVVSITTIWRMMILVIIIIRPIHVLQT